MALVTLNTSVDVPDSLLYQTLTHSEAAKLVEMESIAEILMKVVDNQQNPFKETQGDDNDEENFVKKTNELKFFQPIAKSSIINTSNIFVQKQTDFQNHYFFQFISDITPPPPKA